MANNNSNDDSYSKSNDYFKNNHTEDDFDIKSLFKIFLRKDQRWHIVFLHH